MVLNKAALHLVITGGSNRHSHLPGHLPLNATINSFAFDTIATILVPIKTFPTHLFAEDDDDDSVAEYIWSKFETRFNQAYDNADSVTMWACICAAAEAFLAAKSFPTGLVGGTGRGKPPTFRRECPMVSSADGSSTETIKLTNFLPKQLPRCLIYLNILFQPPHGYGGTSISPTSGIKPIKLLLPLARLTPSGHCLTTNGSRENRHMTLQRVCTSSLWAHGLLTDLTPKKTISTVGTNACGSLPLVHARRFVPGLPKYNVLIARPQFITLSLIQVLLTLLKICCVP